MRRLRRFLLLPAGERWLIVKTALLLQAISLGMWLLPFQTLRRLLARVASSSAKAERIEQPSVKRIVWAVETANSYLPGKKTCLNLALTAQTLLICRGYEATVQIGVVKERGQLKAHAWVEGEDGVLIGGHELDRYARLTGLESERHKRDHQYIPHRRSVSGS
jgi:hypothetical protein